MTTPANKYLILILHNEVAYLCESLRHGEKETVLATYLAMLLENDMVTRCWYQCIECNIKDKALIANGKKIIV